MTRAYHASRRPTLRHRILAVFAEHQGHPIHYTWVAQQFGWRNPRQVRRVREACWVMWCQKRLAWVKPGVYQLPQEEQKGAQDG